MFKGTYDTFTSHKMMIKDSYRTSSYHQAIIKCIHPGDVVIDFGSGSGLLSMMAARCHAKKVYAIERNPRTADWLKHNISVNGLDDIVSVFCGNAEHFIQTHPDINVDVAVSECIGDHLFENKMIKEFLQLCQFYNISRKIPSCFSMNLYPSCITEKTKNLDLSLNKLQDHNIIIDFSYNGIEDQLLENSYFSNFNDQDDYYFTLQERHNIHQDDCLFTFDTLDKLCKYKHKNGCISQQIQMPAGNGYLLFYFDILLYDDIKFTNHPGRRNIPDHSFYQRLLKKEGAQGTLFVNIDYEQTSNEDSPSKNIWIEYD